MKKKKEKGKLKTKGINTSYMVAGKYGRIKIDIQEFNDC